MRPRRYIDVFELLMTLIIAVAAVLALTSMSPRCPASRNYQGGP